MIKIEINTIIENLCIFLVKLFISIFFILNISTKIFLSLGNDLPVAESSTTSLLLTSCSLTDNSRQKRVSAKSKTHPNKCRWRYAGEIDAKMAVNDGPGMI